MRVRLAATSSIVLAGIFAFGLADVLSPGLAAAQARPCPAGERWDAAMEMCMPAPVEGGAPLGGHMHAHAGQTNAAAWDQMISFDLCAALGSYYDPAMSMCLPQPRGLGHAMLMPMLNAFLVDSGQTGTRARHSLAGPNWLMINGGLDLASWNRVEADLMLTVERWTFPDRGYAEYLQIGERNELGVPFVDSQHPHSSPIMGLAITDVIAFGRDRLLRLSFAPRGMSTDGPIPFMHRPSAQLDPDVPLGHHVGQDVGHISSTVISAMLVLGGTTIEASTFNGREPHPERVDLPIDTPNSFALRVSQRIGRRHLAMASVAYVQDPEELEHVDFRLRFSASAYGNYDLPSGWRAHATLVWGGVTNLDGATFTNSLLGEALFSDGSNGIWSRLEVLQRTAGELGVVAANSPPTDPRWVGAWTVGVTRRIASLWAFDLAVGVSGTLSFVPEAFSPAYGATTLATGRLFLQLRGMRMWMRVPQGDGTAAPH